MNDGVSPPSRGSTALGDFNKCGPVYFRRIFRRLIARQVVIERQHKRSIKLAKFLGTECFDGFALRLVPQHQFGLSLSIAMECAKPDLGVPEKRDYFGAQIVPEGGVLHRTLGAGCRRWRRSA